MSPETARRLRLLQRILRHTLEPEEYEAVLGDLEELHAEIERRDGPRAAALWYGVQILRSLPPFLYHQLYWRLNMLANYLTLAWRNMRRHKSFALINILGLSLGLACCILIAFYITDETGFDRFHEHVDRIHGIRGAIYFDNAMANFDAQPPLADQLPALFPEVEAAVRVTREELVIRRGDRTFKETGLSTEPVFFRIFTFPLRQAATPSPLREPDTIVISPALAQKYFAAENPLGQTLSVRLNDQFKDFTVTGVLREIPATSSLRFDFAIPLGQLYGDILDQWDTGQHLPTFLLLKPHATAAALEGKFAGTVNARLDSKDPRSGYHLFALAGYHLSGDALSPVLGDTSSPTYSCILAGIALMVLLIACFNFMNLSVGQFSFRIKEIGLRKTLGAGRRELLRQFWCESIFTCLLALAAGSLLAFAFRGTFNQLAGKALNMHVLDNPWIWLGLFLLALGVGALTGSYPAFFYARHNAVDLFRQRLHTLGKERIARGLILMQFSMSIFLIIGTVFMHRQYRYLLHRELGFDSQQVVVIPLDDLSAEWRRSTAFFPTLKQKLLARDAIRAVSGAQFGMSSFWASTAPMLPSGQRTLIDLNWVDEDFLKTLDIGLVQGRPFSRDFGSDAGQSFVVNERLVRQLGLTEPLGRQLSELFSSGFLEGKIVGVVRDFHVRSLHKTIYPALMLPGEPESFSQMFVRIDGSRMEEALAGMREDFQAIAPEIPFRYSFMSDDLAAQYSLESRWSRIIRYGSVFSLLIACSGLFGLTLLAVVRRTKEIGIRKVMGASILGIIRLVCRDFFWLIIAANAIAWPAAYFALQRVLAGYAYRPHLEWPVFWGAGLTALLIAMVTVGSLALRAGRANPVDSLRYE